MTNLKLPEIVDFGTAHRYMKKCKPNFSDGARISIGYMTWLTYHYNMTQGSFFAITHHQTDIIKYYRPGNGGAPEVIALNTGGYTSKTTIDRMHRLTPPMVRVNIKCRTAQITIKEVARPFGRYAQLRETETGDWEVTHVG